MVDNETANGLKSGDTIRPANGAQFSEGTINKSQGKISKEGKSFLMDGDYKTIGIGNKSFKLKKLMSKFSSPCYEKRLDTVSNKRY